MHTSNQLLPLRPLLQSLPQTISRLLALLFQLRRLYGFVRSEHKIQVRYAIDRGRSYGAAFVSRRIFLFFRSWRPDAFGGVFRGILDARWRRGYFRRPWWWVGGEEGLEGSCWKEGSLQGGVRRECKWGSLLGCYGFPIYALASTKWVQRSLCFPDHAAKN